MNEDNACLVRCRLVPARDPQQVYDNQLSSWAEPDIEHAAEMLHRLKNDLAFRDRIGRKAAHDAAARFSVQAYGAHIKALLETSPHDGFNPTSD
jgi:hypothetical protein